MDFGLARDWKEQGSTATGSVLGTPHYMAPEQARGEVSRLDRRADVYSLGATLYTLLTGQPPIPGGNGLEVLSNIASLEPRPPRALNPDLPADLEAIILKCLEKERSARYDSARALAEDLDRFLGGEPVRARPTGLGYRLRKRLRKHRVVVGVAAAALLAVALAVVQVSLTRREATRRERLARASSPSASSASRPWLATPASPSCTTPAPTARPSAAACASWRRRSTRPARWPWAPATTPWGVAPWRSVTRPWPASTWRPPGATASASPVSPGRWPS